jgi:hypothetical protein
MNASLVIAKVKGLFLLLLDPQGEATYFWFKPELSCILQ